MSDFDNNVIALMVLQEENERLKRLSKEWLEEKKTLNDKLNKIEQIVKQELSPLSLDEMSNAEIQIREIIEQE